MEPVYGTVIQLARLVWRAQGLTFTVTGVENLPRTGGAMWWMAILGAVLAGAGAAMVRAVRRRS